MFLYFLGQSKLLKEDFRSGDNRKSIAEHYRQEARRAKNNYRTEVYDYYTNIIDSIENRFRELLA